MPRDAATTPPSRVALVAAAQHRVVVAATLVSVVLAPAVNVAMLGLGRPWPERPLLRFAWEGLVAAPLAFALARWLTRSATPWRGLDRLLHAVFVEKDVEALRGWVVASFAGVLVGGAYGALALVVPALLALDDVPATERASVVLVLAMIGPLVVGPVVGACGALLFELAADPHRRALAQPTLALGGRSWTLAARLFAHASLALFLATRTSLALLELFPSTPPSAGWPSIVEVPLFGLPLVRLPLFGLPLVGLGAALVALLAARSERRAHHALVTTLREGTHPWLALVPLSELAPTAYEGLLAWSDGTPSHAVVRRDASSRGAPTPLAVLAV